MKVPGMPTVWLLWRIFFAVVFLGVASRLVFIATTKAYMAAFGYLVFAAAAFVLAVLMVSPDLAKLGARPFIAFIDSIYMPGGYEKRPLLDYSRADYYRRTGRLEMAEEEYAQIVRYYPKELRAYLGMLDVYVQLDDRKAAEKILRKAERQFRRIPKALERLAEERAKMWEKLAGSDPDV